MLIEIILPACTIVFPVHVGPCWFAVKAVVVDAVVAKVAGCVRAFATAAHNAGPI